jgi:glycosyltransferase involved in cell wall biosynthesis
MNILQLESSLQWGGCEKRCVQEVAWLRRHGHEAWIACDPRGKFGTFGGREVTPWLIPISFSFAINPFTIFELFKIVRDKKIDILHTHEALDSTLAFFLHIAGIPVVRSRHWALNPKVDLGKIIFYSHSCRKLIAVSRDIFDTFAQKYRVPLSKLVLIGDGAEPAPTETEIAGLRKKFRKTWGIPEDATVFAIIGIIRGEKGHNEFVEAALRVLEKNTGAWFMIIGEGGGDRKLELSLIDLLRQKAREGVDREILRRIIWTGFYQEIREPFAGVDIVVVPSHTEGQPKVVPEAMQYCRAVIASRVGGLPELIEDGKTGLLVPSGDINALSDAMLRLTTDRELRQKISLCGRDYAKAHLLLDQRMEELLKCYASCL